MPTPRLTVLPATEAHAEQLAAHLRPEDAAELMISHGLQPIEGLRLALNLSSDAKTILDGTHVVAMFGVAPGEGVEGVASVWMLTGTLARKLKAAFKETVSEELARLTAAWSVLINMVWEKNEHGLRWLKSLGFEVFEPVPFGVSGQPFHPVRLTRRP